jgi:hypothetical protein
LGFSPIFVRSFAHHCVTAGREPYLTAQACRAVTSRPEGTTPSR